MNLQESGEMYLESIYVLCKEKKNVRSIDIVEYMNFSKPSVSRAVGLLKSGGYITVDSSGFITLTDVGLEVSRKIYERHSIISAFLFPTPNTTWLRPLHNSQFEQFRHSCSSASHIRVICSFYSVCDVCVVWSWSDSAGAGCIRLLHPAPQGQQYHRQRQEPLST